MQVIFLYKEKSHKTDQVLFNPEINMIEAFTLKIALEKIISLGYEIQQVIPPIGLNFTTIITKN